ncbi:hypothetical protein GCT13_42080 [Paraburkholderia sp. CNPSo 3157]|uniref:Fis family transcriptional regulator n=1 Tax=Paraburkholderia franconis TaxID=2654983 RepID=A0A7X1TKX9_9BURK|nr:hypothetical protein [Paraburkholderia franconis]MPW23187.1 hypothetical protein [Paraburkholderia franconis]
MARTIPFARTNQAARARRSKTMPLPMPRAEVDRVCLQVHVALDAMRRGMGNVNAAQTLCQVMILTGLLAEAGYGDATFEQMRVAESVVSAAFDRGRDSNLWGLDDDGFRQIAAIVATYDYQMQLAPLAAIAEASDRLERFRAGESFDQLLRKRA